MKKETKKKYHFDKDGHYHSLDGKPLFGTTTALAVIAKPMLIGWASKMAVEHVRSNWKIGQTYTKGERDAILEDARHAHTAKKTAGGVSGTSVHKLVEDEINNAIKNTGGYMKKEWADQYEPQVKNFVLWAVKEKVKFLVTEKRIYSEIHWLGGIVDFVCEIKGKRYIGDIKTSNGIYPEHFLQMGAYDIMLEEMGEPKADGYVIVNLQKSGKMLVKLLKHTRIFKEGFIHALELFKVLKKLKWNPWY